MVECVRCIFSSEKTLEACSVVLIYVKLNDALNKARKSAVIVTHRCFDVVFVDLSSFLVSGFSYWDCCVCGSLDLLHLLSLT
jgi:hypothetical protein